MGNIFCHNDEDVLVDQNTQEYNQHQIKDHGYKITLTRYNFKKAFIKLRQLKPVGEEFVNMLSVTNISGDKFTPELFQIYQLIEDNSIVYYYCHLEENSHTRLEYFKIENINNFELCDYNMNYTIELINGEHNVKL
jgi:hypothetical protein